MGISGRSRDSNPACLFHRLLCNVSLEAGSFTNPNVSPGTYNRKLGLVPKGDKSAARPPEGCPAEAGGLFGPESALILKSRGARRSICRCLRLDTRSIKVGIKGREGREGAETRTLLVCAAHRFTYNVNEASSFKPKHVCQFTASDAWSLQRGQKVQLAHPKVAQPKVGAYSAPSLLLVSNPARMPDGPAPFKR